MDKFDETVYKNQYSKQHYANIGIKIKPENAAIITEYSQNLGISKAELIQKCVLYCYREMIDVSGVPLENGEK